MLFKVIMGAAILATLACSLVLVANTISSKQASDSINDRSVAVLRCQETAEAYHAGRRNPHTLTVSECIAQGYLSLEAKASE